MYESRFLHKRIQCVFTWFTQAMVHALGFGVKAIKCVALAATPYVRFAFLCVRIEAPFIQIVLTRSWIAGTKAFFCAFARFHLSYV